MSSTSEPELAFDADARAPAAWALAGSLVVMHAWTAWTCAAPARTSLLWALFLNRPTRLRTLAGGQVGPLIAEEPWRLVRSVWLHADAAHLAVNAVAIVVLGRLLEPWIGPVRLLWWFAIAGVGGSIASHAAGLLQSDGASGGAFGLLGALWALAWRHRERLDARDRRVAERWLTAFILLNLVLSAVLPFVDAIGHLGGLAVGLLLGARARPEPPTRRTTALEALGVAAIAAIALLGPLWTG